MSGFTEEKMQIIKEILRSTIVIVSGSLIFLVFVAHILGLRAAILLLCGATVAFVAALIFQITDQQNFLPLGHRIVNFYRALALIILNTLILFTCLEMAATFVAKIWKEPVAVNDDGGENSPRAHTSYYASQAWAKQYWKEFSLSRKELYHDYVFWRRAPFTGKFININRDGIRLTPGADCSANSYKVFTFGGSTMWGTGSPDWGTIPAYLQSGLKSLTTKPVCVVNFGESAWVSTQSVIQLMLELQSGNVPALVIFYEGANDVYAAYQSGRATHQNNNQIADKLNKGNSPPPLPPLVAWIKSTSSFYVLNRLMATLRPKPRDSTNLINYKTMGIDTATLTDSMVETYIGNYEIVNALAQKYGFEALFFWQPQIAVGEKSLTNEELEMRRELDPVVVEFYQSVYHRVQQVAKKYENFYYIADTFDSANSQIYIDQVHVTPVGNQLIAERIFREIRGRNLLDKKGSSSSHDL
jgi:lysophospholipase L1-like esterase